MTRVTLLAAALSLSAAYVGASAARADPMLSDFAYPHAVERFDFVSQGQAMTMAYMDVEPENPNGATIVLLHGKNFCAATWEAQISTLTGAGFRVVAPDQIGFCKSSKPMGYQYGLHQLAANTHALMAHLGIETPVVIGHSMGGMLAARYALTYPSDTSGLVMVNPIGLEDWRAKGVPVVTVDQLFADEKKTTRETIKAYQEATYYGGKWAPEYDRWVDMLASMYAEPEAGGAITAWHQALTSDMVFNQPVVHEFGNILVPTALMIGEADTTAIGKARAPEDIRASLGNYAELGASAAEAINNAVLATFPDLGHSPQVEAPARFDAELLAILEALSATP